MLLGLFTRILEIAQSYFDLVRVCDVCSQTGVLIPRRPEDGGQDKPENSLVKKRALQNSAARHLWPAFAIASR